MGSFADHPLAATASPFHPRKRTSKQLTSIYAKRQFRTLAVQQGGLRERAMNAGDKLALDS